MQARRSVVCTDWFHPPHGTNHWARTRVIKMWIAHDCNASLNRSHAIVNVMVAPRYVGIRIAVVRRMRTSAEWCGSNAVH